MARRNTNKAHPPRDLGVIAGLAAMGAALIVVFDNSGGSAPGSSDPGAGGEISSPARPEPVPAPPLQPDLQMLARDSQDPVAAPDRKAATPAEPLSTGSIDANRTPMECVPATLKTVLNEVSARFGPLTIVSTTHLQTDNHVSGSDRAKLHAACKAVDFRIEGAATDEVLRYLRGRRGIAGLTSYRGGLIHIDANERYTEPSGR